MPAYTVGAMVKEDDKWHKAVFRVNAASATAARRKVGQALTKAGTPHNLQQVRRVTP